MIRTRFLTVAIAILALWGVMQAQSPTSLVQDTSLSFQQILALAQPMLDSMRAQNGGIPTHDEKVFSRWREFWGKHIDYPGSKSGGDFKAAMNYHRMLAQGNMSICDQGVGPGQWSLLGPIRDEVVNNVKTMHMGIVNAVATNPSNPSIIYAGCNFSGVWRTVDTGLNWQCVTDPLRLPLLPVHGLAIDPVDPQIIFAGTGETSHNGVSFGLGIFRSTDSGSSWALCQGFSTIYDPTDPTRGEVNVIRFHPNYANNGIMLAAGRREIYQSMNRGVSWTLVMQIPFTGVLGSWDSFFDLEFAPGPNNQNVVLAATREGHGPLQSGATTLPPDLGQLFASSNSGSTWSSCLNCGNTPPTPFIKCERLAIAPSIKDGALYVSFYEDLYGPNTRVVKTTDGQNFTFVSSFSLGTFGCGFHKFEFAVSEDASDNPNIMYFGGTHMFKRDNGTGTLTTLTNSSMNTHDDVRALEVTKIAPGNDRVVLGLDGGVAVSPNTGAAFQNINGEGLAITQFYGFDFQPETGNIVGGTQDNGTLFYNGNGWSHRVGGDGGWVEIDDHNSQRSYFGINWHWLTNSNGLLTPYQSLPSTGDVNDIAFLDSRIAGDPKNPNIAWSGGEHFLKWINTAIPGALWSAPIYSRPTTPTHPHHLADIAFCTTNPNAIYLCYSNPDYSLQNIGNTILRSSDGGLTFDDITSNLRYQDAPASPLYLYHTVTDLEVDPMDYKHVYAAISGYGWSTANQVAVNRVFESIDAGATWIPRSTGLPPFPVNYLCYQTGSGGVVYAATDAGVYRLNPATNVWDCFNAGLPPARCSRVLIDYCRHKVLVATYGRGIWEAPLPAVPSYHVTTSQTWPIGSIQNFSNNLIVNPNVTLIIKGKVNFAEGHKLIVMYGGKVVLDGGTLSSTCDVLWGGVDLFGNGNYAQVINQQGYDPFHGIIDIKNGGTIENAKVGITTSLHDTQGNFMWFTYGGIIRCSNAKFLNNKIDVLMTPFAKNNRSYFKSCLFETNRALKGGEKPVVHASLWGVRNIPFEGCTFRYSAGNAYAQQERGWGISGRDATYLVDWKCTGYNNNGCISGTPTVFENLLYGIEHETTNPLLSPAIRHCTFTKNLEAGIKLVRSDYAIIEDNYFDVGTNTIATSGFGKGVYLDRCTKYSFQSNKFVSTVTGNNYGVIAYNSGDDLNRIYNNDFTGVKYGISAQGDNDGPATNDGLVINCNDFTGGDFGVMVSGVGIGYRQGFFVQNNQQRPIALVRNRYYTTCTGANTENKFYVQLSPAPALWHRCNPNPECRPEPQPSCSNAGDVFIDVDPAVSFIKSTHCQRLPASNPLNINAGIYLANNRLAQAQKACDSIIDGGNTHQILADLAAQNSSEGIQHMLHAKSPYLSDEVLGAFMDRRAVVSSLAYKVILVENSPLEIKMLSRLGELSLSATDKQVILNAQVGVSEREKLKGDSYFWTNDLEYWHSEKLRYYLHDTLDSSAFDTVKRLVRYYQLDPCYAAFAVGLDGNLTAADEMLASNHNCNLVLSDFEQMGLELRKVGMQCFMIDAQLGDTTHEEAFDTLPLCFPKAQALLEQFLNFNTKEIHFQPEEMLNKKDVEEGLSINAPADDLKVFPNPAHDAFTIEFSGDEGQIYQLKMSDIAGRVVFETELVGDAPNKIPLKSRLRGIYVYQVFRNGYPWKTGKLIVD